MIVNLAGECLLMVHATAGARRTRVGGQHAEALRVSVTEPADKGRANKAIVKALAAALDIPQSQIELKRGATSRRKTFAISNPSSQLPQRVAELATIS